MGRHAVLGADRPFAAVDAAPVGPAPLVPHRIPAPRAAVVVPLRSQQRPAPVAGLPTTGFPRPAWVPPGYDAPPAGLDGPLDGPPVVWSPPRVGATAPSRAARRTTTAAVVGAIGAGIALLATGGTALTAIAQTAAPATSAPSPRAASTTAEQCSDAVADLLDETASALASGSRTTWSSTAASRAGSVAATYGRDSAEYTAYAGGAAEILDWLRDPTATESYATVVDRVVPTIVATCDRAYG